LNNITHPTTIRRLLKQYGLYPKKGLGQHFLHNKRVLSHIIKAAVLSPQDIVLEVGPGLGILTKALAQRAAKVIAIEIDPQLASFLTSSLSPFPNVKVIQGDILALDPAQLVNGSPYKVVANIPYYITSPILRHFLEASLKPRLMVIMVQREVAEAITAKPGEMSLLSVSVQLYSRPQIIEYISPKSFYPPPKVESAILRLDTLDQPAVKVDTAEFFHVVGAGFSTPRKQLHNSLAHGLNLKPQEVAVKLKELGIDPQRRPQSLSLAEWAKIWQVFKVEIKL